jgi:hypothetical protein
MKNHTGPILIILFSDALIWWGWCMSPCVFCSLSFFSKDSSLWEKILVHAILMFDLSFIYVLFLPILYYLARACYFYVTCLDDYLSVFRPRGVPGPTSKLSPRAPAQMGRREMEHEGGKRGDRRKGETCGLRVCPAPRSGALAVGVTSVRVGGSERLARAVPSSPRGQPSRTSALDLPFIGVRRGPRCTIGDVAGC